MRFNLQSFFLFAFIFSLFACSSGDTEEFRTAVYVNDLDIVSIEIDVAENQDTLDVNDAEAQLALPVIATLGDGSTTPVSRFLQWSSSDQSVISVNGSGIARPVTTGVSTITATLGDFSDSIVLDASDAPLVDIRPIASGTPLICSFNTTLSAMGVYRNEGEVEEDVRDISDRVTWTPSDATIATVEENDDEVPTILALKDGLVTLTARRGSVSSTTPLSVTIAAGTLSRIELNPDDGSNLERDKTYEFTATGFYQDASSTDITRAIQWEPTANFASGNQFRASVDGDVTIEAECGNVTETAEVTVIPPRTVTGIEIRDSEGGELTNYLAKRPTDNAFQLRVALAYSGNDDDAEPELIPDDNNDLNWEISSGSGSVLSVDNTDGNKGYVRLLGNNLGSVTLKAKYLYNDSLLYEATITIDVRLNAD